jgi:hypothetical protein
MFPNEVAVVVNSVEGRELSFFLSTERVRNAPHVLDAEDVDAQIPVEVLGHDERASVVLLPTSAIEGTRVLRVSGASLSS